MPNTWWLSFVDEARPKGQRFLGVVLVEAESFVDALDASHRAGVNPGGQCAMWSMAEWPPPPEQQAALAALPRLTLLPKATLDAAGLL